VHIYDKIIIENSEKAKIILHEIVAKRWFRSAIHSLRRWDDENADVIYVIWRISQFLLLTHSNWRYRL